MCSLCIIVYRELHVLTFSGHFVMEYCGEVCTSTDFEARKVEYVKEKRRHYYFMSLKADEVHTI